MDSELHHQLLYWKNKLEKEHRDEKIIRLLQKLQSVPISVDLLMGTEIGKTVNKMKKKDGKVGSLAKSLVVQWKDVVSNQKSSNKCEENVTESNPYLSQDKSISQTGHYDPGNAGDDYKSFRKTVKDNKNEKRSSFKLNGVEESDDRKQNGGRNHNSKKSKQLESPSKSSSSDRSSKSKDSSSSKSHSKRKHSDKKKYSKELNKRENFDNQIASFEDCLGFNDIVPLKKKKVSVNTSASRPKLSTLGDKHHRKSTKDVPIDAKTKHFNEYEAEEEFDKVDILSTLPEIQPDYRPMPRYDPPPLGSSFKLIGADHEEEMFKNCKSSRTKLYSGRATNYIPEVLTLQDFCLRVLSDNVDEIRYLGNVPYFIIKSVLENCSATQLYAIEYFNPYLVEETDELWQLLSVKEFRGKCPDEMETWREMFLRLSDEREAKLKSITANISASMAKATPVRQTKLAYVDSVAKPPRCIARAQARQGTGLPIGYKMKGGPPGQSTSRPRAPAINVASSSSNHTSQMKVKQVAPLMQKTLKFMKNRFRR